MAGGSDNLSGTGITNLCEQLDEYKCHANNMDTLRETYRDILAELADSTVGQQIIREVRGDYSYVLEKFSTTLGDDIIKSEYFLS